MIFYSFIIPLYNRPDEIRELLETLTKQTYTHFEVLVIEDGSKVKGEAEVNAFKDRLDVQYFYKENEGQGFTRNYGFARAKGDYFIILDSDVLVPENYLEYINDFLKETPLDAFGGPDAAHPDFTPIQKAISYAMTSLFTTGGIRGRKKHLGKFQPRSFNMGISKEVYKKTKGFIITRMGEDLEFSLRILKKGFKTGLIDKAFVYHKRRTDFRRFFNQLKFFGKSRINVYQFFPESLKLMHWFPFCFLCYVLLCIPALIFGGFLGAVFSAPLGLWSLAIFLDATLQNKSLWVGFLSVIAALIQLCAYGIGFIQEFVRRVVFKRGINEFEYPD